MSAPWQWFCLGQQYSITDDPAYSTNTQPPRRLPITEPGSMRRSNGGETHKLGKLEVHNRPGVLTKNAKHAAELGQGGARRLETPGVERHRPDEGQCYRPDPEILQTARIGVRFVRACRSAAGAQAPRASTPRMISAYSMPNLIAASSSFRHTCSSFALRKGRIFSATELGDAVICAALKIARTPDEWNLHPEGWHRMVE